MNQKQNTASQTIPWYEWKHKDNKRLHIEYRKDANGNPLFEIVPDNNGDIPMLNDFLHHNLRVANPYWDFDEECEYGLYEYICDSSGIDWEAVDMVDEKAKIFEIISNLWDSQYDKEACRESEPNVLQLLSRLLQKYVEYQTMIIPCIWEEDEEEEERGEE